jgi:hypothetical protein
METAKKLFVDLAGFTSKLIAFFLVLVIFIVVAYSLFVSPLLRPSADQTFSVQGTAKIDIKPDTALIDMGATNTSIDVAALKKASDKAIGDTKTAIIALGVPEDKVKSSLSINPNYDYSNNSYTIKNYTAVASMEVKTTDFTIVDKILDAAIANKLNVISNVSFIVDDTESAKTQIREEAIQKAKDKASKLAVESGLNLGKVINVIEDNLYVPIYYNTALKGGVTDSSNGSTPSTVPPTTTDSAVSPGLNTISITVTLVYEIK